MRNSISPSVVYPIYARGTRLWNELLNESLPERTRAVIAVALSKPCVPSTTIPLDPAASTWPLNVAKLLKLKLLYSVNAPLRVLSTHVLYVSVTAPLRAEVKYGAETVPANVIVYAEYPAATIIGTTASMRTVATLPVRDDADITGARTIPVKVSICPGARVADKIGARTDASTVIIAGLSRDDSKTGAGTTPATVTTAPRRSIASRVGTGAVRNASLVPISIVGVGAVPAKVIADPMNAEMDIVGAGMVRSTVLILESNPVPDTTKGSKLGCPAFSWRPVPAPVNAPNVTAPPLVPPAPATTSCSSVTAPKPLYPPAAVNSPIVTAPAATRDP